MEKKIQIVIADDHPIFLNGLKQIIQDEDDIEIIGESGDGENVLEQILDKKPDIAVLDIDMPKKTGFEVLKEVNKLNNPVKIIFLTMYKEENLFNEAMDLGIKGYVLKESAANDICECIRLVANDDYAISPLISNYLVNRIKSKKKLENEKPNINDLTCMERKVLKLISENKSSKEIGEELFISFKTVETHRTNISRKLDLHGNLCLVRFAMENRGVL
ncbi:MAG: Transcriptional regulatory protein DegU [Ignavibacteria bacterium]|nr:Transcriptional regulatory protein DegU [Ignavibacteria bacterium]